MTRHTSHANHRTRGFSLMELMVVIAILGILVTLVATNVMPAIIKTNITAAKTEINTFYNAVIAYKMDHFRLPDNLAMLTQPDPKNGNEPYVNADDEPIDPWGNPYIYTPEGSKFTILSYGADGQPGGEGENADISSADLKKKKAD